MSVPSAIVLYLAAALGLAALLLWGLLYLYQHSEDSTDKGGPPEMVDRLMGHLSQLD